MNLLLTGAGFSRNWGGWLASEAFEYLLGAPEVGDDLRRRLLEDKLGGKGFEDTLGELQERFRTHQEPAVGKIVDDLTAALVGMFNLMDQGFAQIAFEPQNVVQYLVAEYLARFDAIFTLNQDLLLERHYLNQNVGLAQSRRWSGFQLPGVRVLNPHPGGDPRPTPMWVQTPDPATFTVAGGAQPYFKLHGSSNFVNNPGGRILVMGGNKAVGISQEPLLQWYHRQFEDYLGRAEKLMVIGYSFSDSHINKAIQTAATRGLRMFIVDPDGIDVLDKNRHMTLKTRHPLVEHIAPHVTGASRRPLISTFGGDHVEFAKLDRFLKS